MIAIAFVVIVLALIDHIAPIVVLVVLFMLIIVVAHAITVHAIIFHKYFHLRVLIIEVSSDLSLAHLHSCGEVEGLLLDDPMLLHRRPHLVNSLVVSFERELHQTHIVVLPHLLEHSHAGIQGSSPQVLPLSRDQA